MLLLFLFSPIFFLKYFLRGYRIVINVEVVSYIINNSIPDSKIHSCNLVPRDICQWLDLCKKEKVQILRSVVSLKLSTSECVTCRPNINAEKMKRMWLEKFCKIKGLCGSMKLRFELIETRKIFHLFLYGYSVLF